MAPIQQPSDRLVLNNIPLTEAREIAKLISASRTPLKITTGAEHGHQDVVHQWIQLVLVAESWKEYLPLLRDGAIKALGGLLMQRALAMIPSLVRSPARDLGVLEAVLSKAPRLVLTIESSSGASANLHLENATEEEIQMGIALIATVADRVQAELDDAEEVRGCTWEIKLEAGSAQLERSQVGKLAVITDLDRENT